MILQQIIEYAKNVHAAKNRDYGNSFAKTMDKYGCISAAIRLDDKISRLQRLTHQDASVKSESVFDTWLDLFNYALMTAEYLSSKYDKIPDDFDYLASSLYGITIGQDEFTKLDACAALLVEYACRVKLLDSNSDIDIAKQTAAVAITGLKKMAAHALISMTRFDTTYLDPAYTSEPEN